MEEYTGARNVCADLPPPIIIMYSFPDKNTYGYFSLMKPQYIFINLDHTNQYGTAVHESVHYIAHAKFPKMSRCQGEYFARKAKAAYSNQKYNPKWRVWYGCLPS